jgi:hypothetical protein
MFNVRDLHAMRAVTEPCQSGRHSEHATDHTGADPADTADTADTTDTTMSRATASSLLESSGLRAPRS